VKLFTGVKEKCAFISSIELAAKLMRLKARDTV
jgi:hypothetical protein